MNKILILFFLFVSSKIITGQNDSVTVNSIDFVGNNFFSSGTLKEVMETEESSLFGSSYFDEDDLKDDFKILIAFYNSEGFFQANIDGYNITLNEDSTEVNISINVFEGGPSYLKSIKFQGNHFFPDQQILEKIPVKLNARYQYFEVNKSKINIKKMYNNNGFLDAVINSDFSYDEKDHSVDIIFIIEEKERLKIHDIVIENLEVCKPNIVERELDFEKGQYINLGSLLESQRKLYQTGLFKSVILKPIPTADSLNTERDILISVKEDDPGEFYLSGGYGTIEKFRTESEVSYKNILGRAYKAKLNGKLSQIEKSIETTITDPWIFGFPVGASLVGTIGINDEPSYNYKYYEVKLNLYKEFLTRSKIGITGDYQFATISHLRFPPLKKEDIDTELTQEELDQIIYLLSNLEFDYDRISLKVPFIYDLRNDLFNPSSGFYFNVSTELVHGTTSIIFLNELLEKVPNTILRTEATIDYFYPVIKYMTLASSIQIGIISNFSGDEPLLLLNDLFYAGGPSSLRGFDYKKVGPLSSNRAPEGGQLKFVWNVFELRGKLIWLFDFAVFFDLGNVWKAIDGFKFNTFRYSPGLGFRINSPIGLIRFDYGFNPWPKAGENRGQYWIGIGHAF